MPSRKKRDFTLYLSHQLFDLIDRDSTKAGFKRSTLIEDILRQHYNLPPE